jgi:hypothetical protein
MDERLPKFNTDLVMIDVAQSDSKSILCDPSKVSRKDKPTVMIRANDSVYKVPAESALDVSLFR